jgi:hypothetical protein
MVEMLTFASSGSYKRISMKNLFLALFMLFTALAYGQGDAPPFVKGQGQAAKTLATVIEVPNKQATKTSSSKTLIETGNDNLLENPSFEATALTGWDFNDGTEDGATSSSSVTDGAASISFSPVAESIILYQDTTLYASALAGNQGFISADVYSTSPDVYLCQRKDVAGVGTLVANTDGTNITNCIRHSGSSTVEQLKLPIIFDPTGVRNGFEIVSLVATTAAVKTDLTGTVRVDSAKMEKGTLASIPFYGPWTPYTPVFTGFGTVTPTIGDIQYRTAPQGIEIRGKFTTGTGTGTEARISLPTGLTSAGTASIPTIQIAGEYATNLSGANSHGGFLHIEPSVTYLTIGSQGTFGSTSIVATAKALGSDFSTGIIISFNNVVVPIASMTNSTSIYSAQCGASCEDTFVAKISGSTITGENVSGWITSATATVGQSAVVFRSGTFTVAPTCVATAFKVGSVATIQELTATTTSGGTWYSVNAAGADTASDYRLSCTKNGADFTASRTIIGSFKEVDVSPGITKPKTCHYAFGGASATLASPTECTSGTCIEVYDSCNAVSPPAWVSTATYENITIANGTFANSSPILCDGIAFDTTANQPRKADFYFATSDQTWSTTSSGGAVLNIQSADVSTAQTSYVYFKCTGSAP